MKHQLRVMGDPEESDFVFMVCNNCHAYLMIEREVIFAVLVHQDKHFDMDSQQLALWSKCAQNFPNRLDGLAYDGRRYVSEERLGNTG